MFTSERGFFVLFFGTWLSVLFLFLFLLFWLFFSLFTSPSLLCSALRHFVQ